MQESLAKRLTQSISYNFRVAQQALVNTVQDKCMRSSAALSFYALFSIAPMIYLAVYIAGIFASDIDFQGQLTEQLSGLLGTRATQGIEVLLATLEDKNQSKYQLVIGTAILAFSATNIFIQIQTTFNDIFSVQSKTGTGLIKQILDRVISLGIILSLGFLLIISMILDSLVVALSDHLFAILNDAAVIAVQIFQLTLLVGLITAVIYSMFQFLPDVQIPKIYKIRGSILVTIMLLLGKYAISLYIGNSKLNDLGGAAASVIVLMLWIYYTSLILFLGAQAIKAMADIDEVQLSPRRYAKKVKTVTID